MARRIIIGEILNLIKGLGGNPSKFMGTKTNINFLGKGPKESLFQGPIDAQGMQASNFPLATIISEAESAGGYATANKLNDLQLQRLKDNLIQLKKAYVPEQVPNITDMASGTGDLTQEGIASLRGGSKSIIPKNEAANWKTDFNEEILGETVKRVRPRQALHQWNPGKGRKPNASGGLAGSLEV